MAGLELKREMVAGDLRDPRRAALPVAAAVGGMVAPALLYVAVNLGGAAGALRGWAVPTATDIAFALAVLAVISSHLPSALRTFLLTLAVVDDLLAITIIALFYTESLDVLLLLAAAVPLALFTVLVQRRISSWWLLLPLAAATWTLVHASGVHATVAGILLGFAVPVVRSDAAGGPDAGPGLAEHFEHRFRPLSAGVAVPVFAFFAAGVTIGGSARAQRCAVRPDRDRHPRRAGRRQAGRHPARHASWSSRYTRASLDEGLSLVGRARAVGASPASGSRCRC